MGALKGLVIGLGAMIVVAMALLAYGLYYKANHPDFKLFADGGQQTQAERPGPQAPPARNSVAGVQPWGDLALDLPAGCRIEDIVAEGGRLYVKSDCNRVLVVDAVGGRLLGTVVVAR